MTLCDPTDYGPPGSSSMEFSRLDYWSGLLFLSPGDFSDPGIEPRSPHFRQFLYHLSHAGDMITLQFSSVQSLSRVRVCNTMNHSMPGLPVHQNYRSLLRLMPIELVMPSSHLILCRPLLLLPPIPPNIRVFSNESTLRMRWPKYWSFSFSISPSNEHPGLISFSMDWLDFHAVQGTLKSLLQHHSPKASIFQCSAFFTVQLSHPYMTTGKNSLD